jgi:hypothetical protein
MEIYRFVTGPIRSRAIGVKRPKCFEHHSPVPPFGAILQFSGPLWSDTDRFSRGRCIRVKISSNAEG